MADRLFISNTSVHSGASDENGGGGVDTIAFADMHDGSGGPADGVTAAVFTDNGSGFFRITKSGSFTNSIVGHLVYLDGTPKLRGKITAVDGSNNYIDVDLSFASYGPADVAVGGFFESWDHPTSEGLVLAGDTIDILGDISASTGMTIAVTGTSSLPIKIRSVNSSGVQDGTRHTITATATISGGVIDYTGSINHIQISSLILDCNDNADYGISARSVWLTQGVRASNAVINGFIGASPYNQFLSCEADGSAGYGFDMSEVAHVVNCISRGNESGILAQFDTNISGCLVYDNNDIGIRTASIRNSIAGCIVYNNGGHGIRVNLDQTSVTHCSMVLNGQNGLFDNVGVGRNVYEHNHYGSGATANTSGHSNLASDTNVINGTGGVGVFNVEGDPAFLNPDGTLFDFTSSELITNGGFDTDLSGWTLSGTVNQSGGKAVLDASSGIRQSSVAAGRVYRITLNKTGTNPLVIFCGVNSSGNPLHAVNTTDSGIISFNLTAGSDHTDMRFETTGAGGETLDDISTKEIEFITPKFAHDRNSVLHDSGFDHRDIGTNIATSQLGAAKHGSMNGGMQ